MQRVCSAGIRRKAKQHLDFDAYDFSYIPIETLSVIYQQFLHAAEYAHGRSEGRERGAYYTPVPLAHFILDTLDRRKPLKEGMRVLDPACGSGVFLVQCYRKLIESRIRQHHGVVPAPEELSSLLTRHLFGIATPTRVRWLNSASCRRCATGTSSKEIRSIQMRLGQGKRTPPSMTGLSAIHPGKNSKRVLSMIGIALYWSG